MSECQCTDEGALSPEPSQGGIEDGFPSIHAGNISFPYCSPHPNHKDKQALRQGPLPAEITSKTGMGASITWYILEDLYPLEDNQEEVRAKRLYGLEGDKK